MIKKFFACLLVMVSVATFTACGLEMEIPSDSTDISTWRSALVSADESAINSAKVDPPASNSTNPTSTTSQKVSTTTTSVSNKPSATSNVSSVQPQSSFKPTGSADLTSEQKAKVEGATNVIKWQLDNGGWGKNNNTTKAFTSFPSDYSWKVNDKFVGTIDNKATYTEMRILAEAYDLTGDAKFKASFDKALAFIKKLQYPSGGFAQIYPHNGKYNDYVTYNDGAMVAVLNMLQEIAKNKAPFQNIVNASERDVCKQMVDKGIDYILQSQITVNGEKSAWCAQHNPTTYKPEMARSYELASISGCESVGIITFLRAQTDNQQAQDAAESARLWLKARRMENVTYSKNNAPNFFSAKSGSYCWFRFYDLTNGQGFYCTRQGKTYTDIAQFYAADSERATGYDWAGSWLAKAGLNY